MMPIHFDGAETLLNPPKGWDAAANGPCVVLPIRRADGACESRWRLSWRERLRVLLGRPVVLSVASGATQPPVALEVR